VTIRKRKESFENSLKNEEILDLLGTADGGWWLLDNPTGATIINNLGLEFTPSEIIDTITPALIDNTQKQP
jgi:hypothetical protein